MFNRHLEEILAASVAIFVAGILLVTFTAVQAASLTQKQAAELRTLRIQTMTNSERIRALADEQKWIREVVNK